jgi:hypothetical protein
MATLRIPENQLGGFEKLIALDDEHVWALASALRDEYPGLNDSSALAEIASSAASISLADANDVVGVLVALYILRARHELSIPDFVEDVCKALDEADAEGLKLSGEDRDRFKDHLAGLLSIEPISVESKALDVQYENERTFQGARIMTDIRPIFGPDPEDPPTGAVIVHTLRITYRERNRMRDLEIALDAEDVSTMRDLLDRADSKASSIKAFLARTELPYIGLDGE